MDALLCLAVRLVLWRSWRRSVVTPRFGGPSLIWAVCRLWYLSWTLLTKSWSALLQRPSPTWPSSDGPAGQSDSMVASRDWWETWSLHFCVCQNGLPLIKNWHKEKRQKDGECWGTSNRTYIYQPLFLLSLSLEVCFSQSFSMPASKGAHCR